MGQGGDLTNLNINCPNIWDIPYNQIPLQKVGDYWGFDTRSVTVQYTETIAVFKMSSEVIKCPTIGAASFGQSPYIARYLPIRGVVGHSIDRCIILDVTSRFYCVSPPIDSVTQSLEGCERDSWVNASCFAAFNLSCGGEEYNASQCIFQQRQQCRYV